MTDTAGTADGGACGVTRQANAVSGREGTRAVARGVACGAPPPRARQGSRHPLQQRLQPSALARTVPSLTGPEKTCPTFRQLQVVVLGLAPPRPAAAHRPGPRPRRPSVHARQPPAHPRARLRAAARGARRAHLVVVVVTLAASGAAVRPGARVAAAGRAARAARARWPRELCGERIDERAPRVGLCDAAVHIGSRARCCIALAGWVCKPQCSRF
jgi:hypothetical protein